MTTECIARITQIPYMHKSRQNTIILSHLSKRSIEMLMFMVEKQ